MRQDSLNIVVVEDEAIIADHLMMTLQSLGFRPWGPAMNLQEAKGYVDRGPVDLVLIDIHYNHELRALFVTVSGHPVQLFSFEITHVKSAHVYVEFHMANSDVHIVRTSMNKVEDTLPPDRFVRVHRSHLINVSYAEHFDGNQLTIHGKKIPVSKSNKKKLVDRFPSLRDKL